jgi:hypothetical protein
MTRRAILLTLALAGWTLGLVACGGEEAASPAEPALGSTEPAAEVPPAPPPTEARPRWDESNFTLDAIAAGPYAANTVGSFELRLDARAGFHVNREYPWMVSVTVPEGVSTPSTTIEAAGMTLAEASARIPVTFTPGAPGTHRITCAVDFGICTEENCQFETRNVSVDVVVAEGNPVPPSPEAAAPAPTEG